MGLVHLEILQSVPSRCSWFLGRLSFRVSLWTLCWLLFCICCSSSQHIFAPLSLVAVYSPRMPRWLPCSRPLLALWCCAHTSAVGPLRISTSDNNMSSTRYLCSFQSLPALKLPCTLQHAERAFLGKCFQALCHHCFTQKTVVCSCFLPWVPAVAALGQCCECE